jgi:hypothetical protein
MRVLKSRSRLYLIRSILLVLDNHLKDHRGFFLYGSICIVYLFTHVLYVSIFHILLSVLDNGTHVLELRVHALILDVVASLVVDPAEGHEVGYHEESQHEE